MIGRTFKRSLSVKGQKTTISRKVNKEYIQYGRRMYDTEDPVTGQSHQAVADQFDHDFKVTASTPLIQRKGFKGIHKNGRQRALMA